MIAASTPSHLFNSTGTVERRSSATSTGRYPAESWATHIAALKCSIQPMRTSEAMKYGATRAPRMYTVFCDPSADIQSTDRIAFVDSRTGTNVTRYLHVVTDPINLIEGGAVLELACESLQGVD